MIALDPRGKMLDLGYIGTKKTIPDTKDSTEITLLIFYRLIMMNFVIPRSHKKEVGYPWKTYILAMAKKLMDIEIQY